jgi:outer membrane protein assembly factor BamE
MGQRDRGVRGKGVAVLIAALVALTGCDAQRDRLMKEKYPSYPDSIKRAIDRNSLVRGMDRNQVYLALGEPMCKKTIERNEKPVEVWLYPPGGRDPCVTAEFRVYFEGGAVTEWRKVPAPRGGG